LTSLLDYAILLAGLETSKRKGKAMSKKRAGALIAQDLTDAEVLVSRDFTRALMIAQEAWKEAGAPTINEGVEEAGKIALALLAVKIVDFLPQE